jgi:hypothetical protein
MIDSKSHSTGLYWQHTKTCLSLHNPKITFKPSMVGASPSGCELSTPKAIRMLNDCIQFLIDVKLRGGIDYRQFAVNQWKSIRGEFRHG